MSSRNLAIKIVLLSQAAVGIWGNGCLFLHYLVLYYKHCILKPTDLILMHLTIANFMIILSKGVPHTMAAFGLKQFFGDFVCKLIFYVYRQGRSMSISTTCLLSVFQAITISARKSYWKILKTKATKYLGLSISTYWILYMTVNFIFPVYVYAKWKGRNITMRKTDFDYCATIGCDEVTGSLYAALFMFPEVLLSVLMVWSSGSMIVSLYRHKQNVQYIHSTGVSWRTSAENRATQSILVTASTFITFYILFAVFQGCVVLFYVPDWWLVDIQVVISLSFPTFGPYFMSHDSIMLRFCFFCLKNTKSHNIIKSM
uniref:Vomeronasal type-1 receptor n=1 Tax=Nannospalax galili TaxID=1026970 RepID=A0A4Y1N4B3_NANGA|nr:vomeronasal type 1 receptor 5 [Nannospalax galili]AWV49413.1 vomeronasal type 1 receptor 5 [Nannospalax galili]AWV49414.1 vomeronasal type 1 receptor 5 [Nannospalax galili]AWV49415.1 vomeronasal type 1 receptor 5 [Nannospalax galili]AWV49416.1 vomeronasal type 1 receptor 5 [Nannospalax galili]